MKHYQNPSYSINTEKHRPLIVDFPRKQTRTKSHHKVKRSVKFSTMADVRAYKDSIKAYGSDMFYSSAEITEMRAERKRDVKAIHMRYALLQSGGKYNEPELFEGCVLTGVENFLTPELLDTTLRRKRGCLHAVLKEQSRQCAEGKSDTELLACASQNVSIWAMKRAERIGCHQSR